jgi:hypothetical protein
MRGKKRSTAEIWQIRQRFVSTFLFEPVDRPPYWETILFWDDTIRRWQTEGMPQGVSGEEYFDMEALHWIPEVPIIWIPYYPPFEEELIEEGSGFRVIRNRYGIKLKEYTRGESIPQFLEFPVKDRASWEALQWRLDAEDPDRYVETRRKARAFNTRRGVPYGQEICPLPVCGGYGFCRNLFGEENLAYAYYDLPELMHQIMRKWLDFYCSLAAHLSDHLEFDFVYIWDDMAYKNGPLISPEMVSQFMQPYYAELIEHLRGLGYRLFLWDSDGDPRKILSLMVGAGINAFLPCEITSGVEPLSLRRQYGPSLSLCGGIDKRVLARSKGATYEEVMRKVPALLRLGGYVPAIDHGIPSDVPFDNYCYFIEIVRRLGREIQPDLLEQPRSRSAPSPWHPTRKPS